MDAPVSNDFKSKLKVVLWRSYKMRRNGLALTIIEMFIPLLYFGILYLLGNTNFFKEKVVDDFVSYEPQPLYTPSYFHVTYSPNISDVNDFMNSVQSLISANNAKVDLEGHRNDDDLLKYINMKLQNDSSTKKVIGVVFNNYNKDSNDLSYRILAETTKHGMDLAFQTAPPYVELWAEEYNNSGFMALQKAIDFAFIDKKAKGKNINIKLEKMPTPPHKLENTLFNMKIMPFIIILSLMLLFVYSLMPKMLNEKILGTKQIMVVMGLEPWQHWLGWFLFPTFAYIFNTIILAIMFTINFTNSIPTIFDHSNGFIIWFFIFCFYVSIICVIFFFSTICWETQGGIMLFMICCSLTLQMDNISPQNIPLSGIVILMFFPILTYIFALHTLLGYERIGGVHFSNLFTKPNKYSNAPSFGLILFMFIIDAIIYFTLAWYIYYVWPGKLGVPKRWNFAFQKSFWISSETNTVEEIQLSALEKRPQVEPVSGLNAGIRIRDLKKKYRYQYAVDGLSIDIYSKQITVLLGHNGAGKTTTISMITGMIPPTSGTIVINGYDVHKNYNQVKRYVGLCLQNNNEIPHLTVLDHLLYFGLLRGCSISETKKEAMEFLKIANLETKANSKPTILSGGMRRKVAIGMAIIGQSKVVLLDEPSSGLDPQARRDLWDFLLALRGERSILITTHYMEEAEVLGDRIAIMHNGHLVCYGTSLFLKNLYGTGYTLTILIENSDPNDILSFVRSYVSAAIHKSSKGGCLIYSLPTNDNRVLSNLVYALDKNKSRLGITNFGIKITSLEEVFIKVGELADANKGITKINQNSIRSDDELTEEFSSNFILSLKALIWKRLYYYKHNKFKILLAVRPDNKTG